MIINKIGYEHIESGLNCQDFGIEYDNKKLVMDGCSGSIHSEVGAKLFAHLMKKNKMSPQTTFSTLTKIFTEDNEINDHLLFTILSLVELEDSFSVDICGDGYIIKQRYDDTLEYEKIGEGNMPPYYAYNFINKDKLSKYKEGTFFETRTYSKEDYKAIGIATDGLQYILDSYYKDEFEQYLILRKLNRIKLLINREHRHFKDDITIAI